MKTLTYHTAEEFDEVFNHLSKALEILNPDKVKLTDLSKGGYGEILNLELLRITIYNERREAYKESWN